MNQFGRQQRPFLFIIDFECNNSIILPFDEIDDSELKFAINSPKITHSKELILKKKPISFEVYQKSFDFVHQNIIIGNSFLVNLTCPTPIEINLNLEEIYEISDAKYKLWIKDQFVCFSPEIFVKIDNNGLLSSFPMKGTIDASLPNAEKFILNDKKELWEHTTIVDLIRNDVSRVAEKVWVEKFRYIDRIQKHDGGELLQVSSQINGSLSSTWKENLGNIFFKMLPAGSITGAPKGRTLEIINEAESSLQSTVYSPQSADFSRQFSVLSPQSTVSSKQFEIINENINPQSKIKNPKSKRGFYTGVFGVFDGESVDSGVMIRFIEQTADGFLFRSGGGITFASQAQKEYEEMIQKIYVPTF